MTESPIVAPVVARCIFVLFVLTVMAFTTLPSDADRVDIAPAPVGEPLSAHFAVSVNNRNSPVYTAHVLCIAQVRPEQRLDGEAAFTSFDMGRGPVSVTVTYSDPVQTVKLLPSSYGIKSSTNGKTITFKIFKPGQVTVEVNGDWNNSLHIFANPYETSLPNPNDPNVIYFGPGVHQIDPMKVQSGQTVYVAAGAVVYGKAPTAPGPGAIFVLDGSNITLRGRGIIDGSLIPKPSPAGHIIVAHGTNIHVEGIIMRDSGGWNFPIYQCDKVDVDNIKIFGFRGNSDGVDINNSSNVNVSDCFFRTFDDFVVIKSSNPHGPDSRDINVKRCVMWNEIAHPLSLGAELNANCENITFSDCDIIHDKGREWIMRVYNSGAAAVSNVVFDNIRIEEARRPISLWIGQSMWVKIPGRGHIDNVVFSNISSVLPDNGQRLASLTGFDADHAVHQVQFKNVVFGGHPITPADVDQNAFVDGVTCAP